MGYMHLPIETVAKFALIILEKLENLEFDITKALEIETLY